MMKKLVCILSAIALVGVIVIGIVAKSKSELKSEPEL